MIEINRDKLIKKGLSKNERINRVIELKKILMITMEILNAKVLKMLEKFFDKEDISDIKYLFNEIAFNEDKIIHKDIKIDAYCEEKIKKNKIKTTYKESPFKSIIQDIKRGLYYVE